MTVCIKNHNSRIMKSVLKHRDSIVEIQPVWENMQAKNRFCMKEVYNSLCSKTTKVCWCNLFWGNSTRLRALITLRLTYQGRLTTKHRLKNFGMLNDSYCCFCSTDETMNNLFYECSDLKKIWVTILEWIQIKRVPLECDKELDWIISFTKGKGWRPAILKLAITETLYGVWKYCNDISYGNTVNKTKIVDNIIIW